MSALTISRANNCRTAIQLSSIVPHHLDRWKPSSSLRATAAIGEGLVAAVDHNHLGRQHEQMKRNTNVAYWPVELHPIFRAIGAAMDGKRLHPGLVERTDVAALVPSKTLRFSTGRGKVLLNQTTMSLKLAAHV
jgi:plasmid stabilization system protein ParE